MPAKKRSTGFLETALPSSHKMPSLNEADCDTLLTTDSGRTISFKQGSRKFTEFALPGSGKTESLLLPSLHSLFKGGCGGLIIAPLT